MVRRVQPTDLVSNKSGWADTTYEDFFDTFPGHAALSPRVRKADTLWRIRSLSTSYTPELLRLEILTIAARKGRGEIRMVDFRTCVRERHAQRVGASLAVSTPSESTQLDDLVPTPHRGDGSEASRTTQGSSTAQAPTDTVPQQPFQGMRALPPLFPQMPAQVPPTTIQSADIPPVGTWPQPAFLQPELPSINQFNQRVQTMPAHPYHVPFGGSNPPAAAYTYHPIDPSLHQMPAPTSDLREVIARDQRLTNRFYDAPPIPQGSHGGAGLLHPSTTGFRAPNVHGGHSQLQGMGPPTTGVQPAPQRTYVDLTTNVGPSTHIDLTTDDEPSTHVEPDTDIESDTGVESSTYVEPDTGVDSSTHVEPGTPVGPGIPVEPDIPVELSTYVEPGNHIDGTHVELSAEDQLNTFIDSVIEDDPSISPQTHTKSPTKRRRESSPAEGSSKKQKKG